MRVLLDTNIWSRLADQRQQDSFVRLVRSMDFTVVVPPATLLEILRTPVRDTARALMLLPNYARLPRPTALHQPLIAASSRSPNRS
jgi:predicted nucleic acid-binding protein